ncbi:hypothetical protein K1719_018059 [Acacia pycnantha]|nr:hypothetical protein K1719_018059 [Acacia pycnantha]
MLLTAVYAQPNELRRNRIWEGLSKLASEVDEPWLLIGDFNEIRTPLEQRGGGHVGEARKIRGLESGISGLRLHGNA